MADETIDEATPVEAVEKFAEAPEAVDGDSVGAGSTDLCLGNRALSPARRRSHHQAGTDVHGVARRECAVVRSHECTDVRFLGTASHLGYR